MRDFQGEGVIEDYIRNLEKGGTEKSVLQWELFDELPEEESNNTVALVERLAKVVEERLGFTNIDSYYVFRILKAILTEERFDDLVRQNFLGKDLKKSDDSQMEFLLSDARIFFVVIMHLDDKGMYQEEEKWLKFLLTNFYRMVDIKTSRKGSELQRLINSHYPSEVWKKEMQLAVYPISEGQEFRSDLGFCHMMGKPVEIRQKEESYQKLKENCPEITSCYELIEKIEREIRVGV